MECQKDKNLQDCACTYTACERRGVCCQCLKSHLSKDELPACFFSPEAEKTYDRSIEHFIRDYQKRSGS